MTNEQKAQRLERQAAWKEGIAHTSAQDDGNGKERSAELLIDAALLREAAGMMRERKGISWTSEGHGMVLTSAVHRNRLMAIVGRTGRTFFWTVSRVAAREHEEFGTADSLEAAQAAAVAWVDGQEERNV